MFQIITVACCEKWRKLLWVSEKYKGITEVSTEKSGVPRNSVSTRLLHEKEEKIKPVFQSGEVSTNFVRVGQNENLKKALFH